jgi:glucokinase
VIPSMVNGHFEDITAQTVYDAAKAGDQVANEIVRDTARYLGAGIANLLNTFNPDTVVIAGGVTAAGDALFVPLRAEVRRRAFKPAVQAASIVPGTLPGTAGMVGAVASFKQQYLGGV